MSDAGDERSSAAEVVDLDAYFRRIGYTGARTPTLDTLRALHALHPSAIPFENLEILLGRPIDLAPPAVDAKLIGRGRGGYCYEHNGLFKRVLTAIGFAVEGLAARVDWQMPADAPPRPRTHMALRVKIDGVEWLADVGFGGFVPTAPLRLDTESPQPDGHGSFRIVSAGGTTMVEAELPGGWMPLYALSLSPMADADYEPANWFVSTHPESHFRRTLIASRVTPEARWNLRDNRLTIRRPGQPAEERLLDAEQLEQALRDSIGLVVEPEWRPLIARAAAAS